jgi:hypothetical protein
MSDYESVMRTKTDMEPIGIGHRLGSAQHQPCIASPSEKCRYQGRQGEDTPGTGVASRVLGADGCVTIRIFNQR